MGCSDITQTIGYQNTCRSHSHTATHPSPDTICISLPFCTFAQHGPPHSPPLTYLPLDEMAAILSDDIFKHIFLNENVRISIQISLKYVPMRSNDNKSALVQVRAWQRTGDKPLSEPMLTQFTDAYICGTRGS